MEVAGDILVNFVTGGKCLRSTFMYLGWLAGAVNSDEALFAAASLELLHAFALLQDDAMDASSSRRGGVPRTSNSANGTASVSCRARRTDSANRRRSCWAIYP